MFHGTSKRTGVLLGIPLLGAAIIAGLRGAPAAQESFPDMPTYNIFTDEELQRDFLRIEYKKPLDRPELGFLLLVPKAWEEVPLTVSREALEHDDENMISLALLRAPEKEAQIEIAYIRVPPTAALEEWARAYMEGNNLEVLHFQTGVFSGRQVFDTLLNAQGNYKVRMTFSRHGDRIYIASGSAPASRYEKYMRFFGLAAVSFHKL
ncbi:MAG: hypothetical protein JW775_04410 [Candidatus Aminicenantes bacterium]|nr:hypothetical protein [Candidatus Aminicenantes bacterium]